MNIFVLHENPAIAASYHCNKHVVKMIVEYVQLMSTAIWHRGHVGPYRPTHKHHPCTLWVKDSVHNYMWLWTLYSSLLTEYTIRYKRTHKCAQYAQQLYADRCLMPQDTEWSLPPQCVHPYCKQEQSMSGVIHAYRLFYVYEKYKFARWSNASIPEWYILLYGRFWLYNERRQCGFRAPIDST